MKNTSLAPDAPGPSTFGTLKLPTRIAFIGNYLPRQCGIATFTTDLCTAIAQEFGAERLFAIPVNDPGGDYQYPEQVRLELEQDDLASYVRGADFLNFNGNDLVCLQHEYGIFGGPAGSHILTLLRKLRMPIVTTLHTVLREPNADQLTNLREIAWVSDRVVVMSQHAALLLEEIYDISASKIDLIPHGVPDLPFNDPNYFKDRFKVEGKAVLLTFGLLSPNKGIENVLRALPAILEANADVVYIVSGATHPHVRKAAGEAYREGLMELARSLGVSEYVIFDNRFVSNDELMEHVGAADIYITPYRREAQVVSGTLAIAFGAGKAIVSTPYWHAKELLANERGVIVPFDDPAAIAESVNRLLANDALRHQMRKRAYVHSRGTTWKMTAHAYMASFQRARSERMSRPRPAPRDAEAIALDRLPLLNTSHLSAMTDDTGILQHAVFSVPNNAEGYTTDDNARALIVATELNASPLSSSAENEALSCRYMAFLWLAFRQDTGRFRNFLSYSRTWLEETGSEDSHGRALWALGTVLGTSSHVGLRGAAGRMFQTAAASSLTFNSPRAWAFALLGMQGYLDWFPGDRLIQGMRDVLANRLLSILHQTRADNWLWFEKHLSYSNARLPQALLLAGWRSDNHGMVEAGTESLRWLLAEQHRESSSVFVPVGSMGFAVASEKERFDQQPVEACATVSACITAYRITGDQSWLDEGRIAFRWFLGENDLQVSLYDAVTGGCRDGLHPDRVNENQGAESTLSFLMALLELRDIELSTETNQLSEMSKSLEPHATHQLRTSSYKSGNGTSEYSC